MKNKFYLQTFCLTNNPLCWLFNWDVYVLLYKLCETKLTLCCIINELVNQDGYLEFEQNKKVISQKQNDDNKKRVFTPFLI